MKKGTPQSLSRRPLVSVETIQRRIFLIRGPKEMLDRDLAKLYGVPTRRLNEQVKRNRNRFPSGRAVQVNILIMRAFVKLREMLASHKDLANKLQELEKKYQTHDLHIRSIFDAIRKLLDAPAAKPKQRIGFFSSTAETS